jgi:hypothetical protein
MSVLVQVSSFGLFASKAAGIREVSFVKLNKSNQCQQNVNQKSDGASNCSLIVASRDAASHRLTGVTSPK